jgi:hypothetical protein
MSLMSENVGASTFRNPKGLHDLYGENITLPYYSYNINMSRRSILWDGRKVWTSENRMMTKTGPEEVK